MRNALILALFVAACGGSPEAGLDLGPDPDDPIWQGAADGKEDTSAVGAVRRIAWQGFVYVPAGADDGTVQWHVRRQVKSALGALRTGPKMMLRDRDARSNLDPGGFAREPLRVLDDAGQEVGRVERVRYKYQDLALVPRSSRATEIAFTMLFDDYVARAGELVPPCADDPEAEADSLWYHYQPTRSSCQALVRAEERRVNEAAARLREATDAVSATDLARRFVTVRASLAPVTPPPVTYPEYDRLFGFGTDRTKVVVYSFFGVDRDASDPRDSGLVEALRYLRTMRAAFPGLRVVETRPFAMLLDFWIDGARVPDVTYEDVARWVVDRTGWPAAASDAARQEELLRQVRDRFLERWVTWQLPVEVSLRGETRPMTIELRTYYGNEDGRPEWRQAAQWRYLEAFWHGDVFSYTGHSHFGHGPLEPVAYHSGNFPDRYQTLLINSCLSYNYYDVDFLEMHPGRTANVEVVSNGLAAYWTGMGESTARYVIGLVDGQNRSWEDILRGMAVRIPGLSGAYDPMRAVTGELDNRFDPAAGQIGLTVR